MMTQANEALAFALELAALAALAVWGAHVGGVAPAIAAPLAAAVFWGVFVAPKASVDLSSAAKFALACVVFAWASAGLIDTGRTWLGIGLAAAFVANRAALVALGDR
jgi:hypothetical protein